MRRWLKEPFLHFVLLGAALFVLSGYFSGSSNTEGEIVVDSGRIEWLASVWQAQWQRPPTRQELEGLVQDYITEEVMYREALALGLDRDDTVVRRRLRQKMEFIAENVSAEDPGDAVLQKFLDENPDTFLELEQLDFRHIYFSLDKPRKGGPPDYAALLSRLNTGADAGNMNNPEELGDTFLPGYVFQAQDTNEINRLFGAGFAALLSAQPDGSWSGPVRSGYGEHLVLVTARVAPRLPLLAEVRNAVLREWQSREKVAARSALEQSLRDRYRITVQWPEAPGTGIDQPPARDPE